VQYIDGYLQQNYTQAQIIKQLEVVCALSPEPFRDQCDNFVETYTPLLISYIIKYEDPQNACAQLGMCSSSSSSSSSSSKLHAMAFEPARNGQSSSSGEFCSICVAAVTQVETYLKQTEDLSEVQAYLEGLCRLTPLAADCLKVVDAYGAIAIQMLEHADPQTVCQQLSACGASSSAPSAPSVGPQHGQGGRPHGPRPSGPGMPIPPQGH
jgi:hypothetical protein